MSEYSGYRGLHASGIMLYGGGIGRRVVCGGMRKATQANALLPEAIAPNF